MKQPSITQAAYKKLSVRSFHSDELRQALVEKGYSKEEIAPLIVKLQEQGYLNDEEWVESFSKKCVFRKWGRNQILQKLKSKRVNGADIEKVLSITKKHEIEVIQTLLSKKDLSDVNVRRKAVNALYRKGFSLDNIRQAIPVEI